MIITVLNGARWIDTCFKSILCQTAGSDKTLQIEVCVFDDASTDDTRELLQGWKTTLETSGMWMKIVGGNSEQPKGVGYGRNYAIKYATGSYLCFQDIDDEMLPDRISKQYQMAKNNQDAIIGSKFIRTPPNSTCRFTRWANELDPGKLDIQIYTTNGPTVIMPTWFCHRKVFDRVGAFCEDGKGTPEDLIFFYKHLDFGGRILRVDEVLLNYAYHENATTFSISKEIIWKIRLERLIEKILRTDPWKHGFTIWNAGKQGRRFFRDLPDDCKSFVRAFCDVDENKINTNYEYFDEVKRKVLYTVPIIHFKTAEKPIVVCMKLDLTNGVFEENLKSMNLIEGLDYVIF